MGWLLIGMVALVFGTAWAMFDSVGWGLAWTAFALVGGAVIGASTDLD